MAGQAGFLLVGNTAGLKAAMRGFSLLEMVVAIAILGMTLGALYQATSGATRSIAVDEKMAYAVELSRSLRALHAVVPLAGLSANGETDGGFVWQVVAQPLELATEAALAEGSLQSLDIVVRWQDGSQQRRFDLATITAGREELLE